MTTLPELLSPHLRAGASAPAQRFRASGTWRKRTYGELRELVLEVIDLLTRAGVERGTRVAIVARTRPEWTVVDLACAWIGAVLVPIYPTSSPAQIADIVGRAAPALLIADPDRELPEVVCPVFRFGEDAGDLGDLAGGVAHEVPVTAQEADVYSIVFSSGSTGAPKGCLLTHRNYASVLTQAAEVELGDATAPAHRERAFVYLPLAHVSARLQQLTTFTLGGELIYGEGGTADILAQVGEVDATYVPGVPRLFESAYLRAGRDPQRLREMFGPSLEYALTGGAPIDPEMLAAYAEAGITLVEGYGLTESSAALTLCAPHCNRPGSVGRALPGVELRIAEDGEILARGANVFAGYLDDPESTSEALADGWLRTGDLGSIDADGFVYVTGRKKNLIVTSTGKNIAPEPMENRMRAETGCADLVVAGDRRPYLVALVFAGDGTEADDATADGRLAAGIRRANAVVSPPERVRKAIVVPRRLQVADGELTASGKIVRHQVLRRNELLLDEAYGARPLPGIRVIEIAGRSEGRPAS